MSWPPGSRHLPSRSRSACSDLDVQGPVWLLTVVAIADAVLGSALGLFVSAFATTEFQAVQFMPAFVLPQILLCGLFVARDQLPPVLEAISNVLPLSYATDAMQTLVRTSDTGDVWQDVAIVAAFAVAALGTRRGNPEEAHAVAPRISLTAWLSCANRSSCCPGAARSSSSSAPCRCRRAS